MTKETKIQKQQRCKDIFDVLVNEYPDARCSLNFDSPLQLLVATQLSAQCTDKRVNEVTSQLFKKYKDAADYANAPIEQLESDIRPTGFFHNKARNLKLCCTLIVKDFSGQVPNTMDELLTLPGVGRKTANVVLGEAFGVPGMVVDTHVGRLARRFGFTIEEDPVKVEFDLMKLFPATQWNRLNHLMIYHGRGVCRSRKPLCEKCKLKALCRFDSSK